MNDLKGGIFQVVANPKQLLFAPFELAIVNLVAAVLFMILCFTVLGWTPFVAMIPLVGGHLLLAGLGAKDQHITTIIQASGKYRPRRKNLTPVSSGVKFVP